MVPVLSRATICVLPAFSKDVAVLNIMPFLAPIPFPTIIATGVARPRAQGQLITRTAIALDKEKPKSAPTIVHIMKVITAIPITIGTNTAETLSAIFAIGAFVAEASLTI